MIAFHKRNFPLHHCMVPAKNFCRDGEGQAQKAPPPPPPPPMDMEKGSKNWQKGRHMNKKAPYKEKNVDFFQGGGGLGSTLPTNILEYAPIPLNVVRSNTISIIFI